MKVKQLWIYISELLENKAKYCPQCGVGTYNRYCSDCGTRAIPMPRCHVCHHRIRSAYLDDYCPHCGTKTDKSQEPWTVLERTPTAIYLQPGSEYRRDEENKQEVDKEVIG